MQDFGKQFKEFQEQVRQTLKRFPRLAASDGQNFFLDSFKRQAWIGEATETWQKRKSTAKRNAGRALLVDRGRLKRSIRIKKADWSSIVVGSDVPYADVHNNGYRGTFNRTASRRAKIKGSYKRLGDEKGRKGKKMMIMGATHKVRQNIPRRRFIGNSPFLNARINRTFILELHKLKQR